MFEINEHQSEDMAGFIRISNINKFCKEFFGLDTPPPPLEGNLENEDIRVNTIMPIENDGYIMTTRIKKTL